MKKDSQTPPRLFLRFFRWYCHPKMQDYIEGDLMEVYERRVRESGRRVADIRFIVDVVVLFRPGIIRPAEGHERLNTYGMYKSYFKIGWRNLIRNKIHSAINIIGLAVSMGVCLTICQYLYYELSFDRFHNNFNDIYRVSIDQIKSGGDLYPYPYETGYAVGPSAKESIPGVNQYARIHKYSGGAVINNPERNRPFSEDALNIFFVDPTFFEMFGFTIKEGNNKKLFNDKFNIVITESAAYKYFGDASPIGKILTVSGGVSPGNYLVTGVLEELPTNSHLQFDFLMPVENYMMLGWGGAATKNDDGWSSPDFTTYIALDESVAPEQIGKKIDQLIIKNIGKKSVHEGIIQKTSLQPISEIHLQSDIKADPGLVRNSGNIMNVQFFLIIAFFILLIAWVNFINLSTARSFYRAKEIGIRKSIGAIRKQLIVQFLTESALINLIAALLSIGIATMVLPLFSSIMERQLELTLLTIPEFWIWFFTISLVGSLLSGLYPAIVLSGFKAGKALGDFKSGKTRLRMGLITFQFMASLLLVSGTYLIYQQIEFMKNQDLGMGTEQILVLKGPEVNLDLSNLESNLQSFVTTVNDHSAIGDVAASSSVPGKGYSTGVAVRKLGAPSSADKFGRVVFAGPRLPETYDLEFVAGVSPTGQMLKNEVVVVINEEAVKAFNLGSAQNAISERLYYKQDTFRIVGVVKNFHWHSLADAHTPYLFEFYNDCRSYFSFKINLSNIPQSLAHIETVYTAFFPGNAFDYFFLEEEFNQQYKLDVQFGKLFLSFSLLAIFIACIGLFSLVSISITTRTKEIGIRKILGAGIDNIMVLLTRDFFTPLLVANILAIPIVIYLGNSWLDNYAFKVGLTVSVFLLPGLVVAAICLLTVGCQTFLAADVNPVKSLKTE